MHLVASEDALIPEAMSAQIGASWGVRPLCAPTLTNPNPNPNPGPLTPTRTRTLTLAPLGPQ